MAENTGFVTNFLAGVVSKESYKRLIADFYFIDNLPPLAIDDVFECNEDNPLVVEAEGDTNIKVGDTVLYSKYGGTELKEDGDDLLILNERDVLAKIS